MVLFRTRRSCAHIAPTRQARIAPLCLSEWFVVEKRGAAAPTRRLRAMKAAMRPRRDFDRKPAARRYNLLQISEGLQATTGAPRGDPMALGYRGILF